MGMAFQPAVASSQVITSSACSLLHCMISALGAGSMFTVRLPACHLNLTDGVGLEDAD